jgi:hypothetical protein
LVVGTKNTFSHFRIKVSWMETCDTLISSPILIFRWTNAFFDFLVVNPSHRARLAFKFRLIVISVVGAFDALIIFKEREIFGARNAFLYFNVVDFFVWTILANFVKKIKEFWVETANALFSCKIFFLRRTFTLFRFFIVNLFKWTFLAVFSRNIEVCIVSWALGAFFSHQNRIILRTSPALVLINMINMVFRACLALFSCVVEIIREVTCDTGFCGFER